MTTVPAIACLLSASSIIYWRRQPAPKHFDALKDALDSSSNLLGAILQGPTDYMAELRQLSGALVSRRKLAESAEQTT